MTVVSVVTCQRWWVVIDCEAIETSPIRGYLACITKVWVVITARKLFPTPRHIIAKLSSTIAMLG